MMSYKDEMRKLIDIVKQQSFDASLEDTLDDMKILTNAVKDLSDRIEMRVRKNLNSNDENKKKVMKYKKPNIQALPYSKSPSPIPSQKNNSLPTSNSISSHTITSNDYDKVKSDFMSKQKSFQPITPQPSI